MPKNKCQAKKWVRHEESHSDFHKDVRVSFTSPNHPGWRIVENTTWLGEQVKYKSYALVMEGTSDKGRILNGAGSPEAAFFQAESWLNGRVKKGRGGTFI